MIVKYKIVELWEQDRTMVVRYYTDVLSEKELESVANPNEPDKPLRCKTDVSISIPLPEPTEQELEKIIWANAPMKALEVLEKLKTEPATANLASFVGKLNVEVAKPKEEIVTLLKPEIDENKIQELLDQIK